MSAREVTLPSGLTVSLEALEPPVEAERARALSRLIYEHLREDQLEDILLGQYSNDARFIMETASVEGVAAGTAWLGWGRGLPQLGVMGGVVTRGVWRGKGIAGRLVTDGCRAFDEAGGQLLFLATTNPDARRMYERRGFQHFVGHAFCRAANGVTPESGFAPGQRVRARRASWRDLAAIVPLYYLPHPCVLVDAGTFFPSTRLSPPWRCVRIFWESWASLSGGGRWMVLENESGWLVASAFARPAGGVGPHFTIDFVWHPDYCNEAAALVEDLVLRTEAATGRACEMLVAEEDEWKRVEAVRFGFRYVGRTGVLFDLNGRKQALERLSRDRVFRASQTK